MRLFFLGTLSIIIIFFSRIIWDAGVFTKITNTEMKCRKLKGIRGPEDFALVDDLLFISSSFYPPYYSFEYAKDKGNLFVVDIANNFEPRKLTYDLPFNFIPHGIDAQRINSSTIRIWAVNHRNGGVGDTIEIFDYTNKKLSHIKTLDSYLLNNTNDIVALDKNEKVLVSHDHGSTNEIGKNFENYTRLGQGYISYYDGNQWKKIAKGFSFANGLVRSHTKVYLAEMLGKKIIEFNLENDTLTQIKTIDLPYFPDNITMGPSGKLIIGAHPKIFNLKKHSEDPRNEFSPSAILEIDTGTKTIKEIFIDDGHRISGSSVAIKKGNHLVIGSIYQNYLLNCEI